RSNSDFSIHLLDVESGESRELTPHEGEAKFAPGPWSADGRGFWLVTDHEREFAGIGFYDLASDSWDWAATPDHDVDELAVSTDGRTLAWVENVDGWATVPMRDPEHDRDLPPPQPPQGPTVIVGRGAAF